MDVLRVELVREIGNVKTYKITYEESESIETRLVGRTFNYDEDAAHFELDCAGRYEAYYKWEKEL